MQIKFDFYEYVRAHPSRDWWKVGKCMEENSEFFSRDTHFYARACCRILSNSLKIFHYLSLSFPLLRKISLTFLSLSLSRFSHNHILLYVDAIVYISRRIDICYFFLFFSSWNSSSSSIGKSNLENSLFHIFTPSLSLSHSQSPTNVYFCLAFHINFLFDL